MTQNLYFSLLSPQESCVYSASSVVKNPWEKKKKKRILGAPTK